MSEMQKTSKKPQIQKKTRSSVRSSIHIEKEVSKALQSKTDNTEQILVSLCARNLKFPRRTISRDLISQQNSFIKIHRKTKLGTWKTVAKTEVQIHTKNPNYETDMIFDFVFEMRQVFRIECYQVIKDEKEFFLGSEIFQLSQLMGNPECMSVIELIDKKFDVKGKVVLRYEKVFKENDENVSLKIGLTGKNLTNFGFFRNKIKPVIKIYRSMPNKKENFFVEERRGMSSFGFDDLLNSNFVDEDKLQWREVYSSNRPALRLGKKVHKFETISLTKDSLVDPEAPDSPIKVKITVI